MWSDTRFGALEDRNFRLFFIGQTASQVGNGMAPVAIVFAVLAHGTASDVGYVLAAQTIPLVILLLAGGVVGDRVNRRTLMLQSDALRAFAECTLGVWILFGSAPLWGFILLGALLGIGEAFFSPALTGIVPQLLTAQTLQQGNALNGISESSGRVIGPAAAGIIVATWGPGWAVLLDGLSYLVSVISLALIHTDWNRPVTSEPFVTLLRQGWHEFRSRSWLWVMVLEALLLNMLFSILLVLGPVIAKESLGGATAWGIIIAAFGVGAMVGGVIMLRVHARRPLFVAALCLLTFAIPLFFVAARAPVTLIAASIFVAGGSLAIFSVLWRTTMQHEVPPDVLSRVSAYDLFGSLAFAPVGLIIAGPLASVFGVTATLVGAGIVMLVVAFVVVLVPSVARLQGPARS